MKVIILPTTLTGNLAPLTDWIPEFLLPVANKPIVEHMIELLVRHGIKEIILGVKHMPYETEQYFHDGARWGAKISYVLTDRYRGISATLKQVDSIFSEPVLLLPGNLILNLNLTDFLAAGKKSQADIIAAIPAQIEPTIQPATPDNFIDGRLWPVILHPDLINSWVDAPIDHIDQVIKNAASQNYRAVVYSTRYTAQVLQSMADYWEINRMVLQGEFPGLLITGKEIEKDLWVGRNTKIHPQAKLYPPVILGARCNIGPEVIIGENSVIGDKVFIDHNTLVQGSIILSNTYVGSQLEVKDAVVRKNCLVKMPQAVTVCLIDDIILADLEKKSLLPKLERIFNLSVALILFIIVFPLFALFYLFHLLRLGQKYFAVERRFAPNKHITLPGEPEPRSFNLFSFKTGFPFINRIPKLINVIKGDMNLIGNSPLTEDEVLRLQADGDFLTFNAPLGMLRIWEIEGYPDQDDEEKLVMENYYAATHSFWGDIKLFFKALFLGGIFR